MRVPSFRVAAVLASLVGTACLAPEAASDVEVLLYPDSLIAPTDLTVQLTHPGGQLVLSGVEFTTTRYATPHSERHQISTSGQLQVAVTLVKAGNDTVAVGGLAIPLSRNRHYGIAVIVSTVNPLRLCMGCQGVLSFPLRGSLASRPDSLFLLWGATEPGMIT